MRIFRHSLTALALVGTSIVQADTRIAGGTIHTMDPANPNPEASLAPRPSTLTSTLSLALPLSRFAAMEARPAYAACPV